MVIFLFQIDRFFLILLKDSLQLSLYRPNFWCFILFSTFHFIYKYHTFNFVIQKFLQICLYLLIFFSFFFIKLRIFKCKGLYAFIFAVAATPFRIKNHNIRRDHMKIILRLLKFFIFYKFGINILYMIKHFVNIQNCLCFSRLGFISYHFWFVT